MTSPISQHLEREVREFIANKGLTLWLDADAHYNEFVDGLIERHKQNDFPYPVVAFRGSHLELMLALEPYGDGSEPDRLLIHLPGFNSTSVSEIPVYELFKAGTRYQKKLTSLIAEATAGLTPAEALSQFLQKVASLSEANEWLKQASIAGTGSFAGFLQQRGAVGVVSDLIGEPTDQKPYLNQVDETQRYLTENLGLPQRLLDLFRQGDGEPIGVPELGDGACAWCMCVEFVHDLKEAPKAPVLLGVKELPPALQKQCLEAVQRIRRVQPLRYRAVAEVMEAYLSSEQGAHPAEALGSIDTFAFEERLLRSAALGALQEGDWARARSFANERTPERCFWVEQDERVLRRTWELIKMAAELGCAIVEQKAPLKRCASLAEAADRYASAAFRVDQAHRLYEQRVVALQTPDLPDHSSLLGAYRKVNAVYRKWVDDLADAFTELCSEYGPLPESSYQQRSLYDEVVHPLTVERARVAYVLVDAFRFEMAAQLAPVFEKQRFQVSLKPRLAELPTVTKLCMNALAPAANEGRLALAFDGSGLVGLKKTGEFTVRTPADRARAVGERSVGKAVPCLQLTELGREPLADLKRRTSGHSLILVVSTEVDDAGEAGLGLSVFDDVLRWLRDAVLQLAECGFEHIVITADHGFLLQGSEVKPQPLGKDKRTPERRHALLEAPSGASTLYEIPLSALNYVSDKERYLVFRRDSAPFDVQRGVAPFVHGGNTLQERVIPVLQLTRKRRRTSPSSRYEVQARALPAEHGRQRLQLAVRLLRNNTVEMSYLGPKRVPLSLRVVGREDIWLRLVSAGPPAQLADGAIAVPPEGEEAIVEFELEGEHDTEQVRVEVYHVAGAEEVAPVIVQGWFQVQKKRKARPTSVPPSAPDEEADKAKERKSTPPHLRVEDWAVAIEDEGYRAVFATLASQRSVSERELAEILGSATRVRIFSRHFDELKLLVPFEIEITVVSGMKSYVKKGER